MVHDFLHLGVVHIDDFLAQSELKIKHCRGVVLTQLFRQIENRVDKRYQLVLRKLVDGVAHHAVHIPYQALALTLHAWNM